MTDERKKYLASISKEEQIIRKTIHYYHKCLVGNKRCLKQYRKNGLPCLLKETREQIRETKVLVKALKKQLPAPRHEQYDYISDSSWLDCGCGKGVYPTQPYCMWCGHKLR